MRDLVVRIGDRVIASVPELDVAAGECVALVGESGSGKTTTLLSTLGLVHGADVRGRIMVGDVDVLTASPARLREIRGSRAALVMQSPQAALNPTMRLGTLMRRALARHGVKGADARERAEEGSARCCSTPRSCAATPTRCPAARPSGSPSRWPSRSARRSCWPTSRPARWT
ncbi:hypothetical protein GCM10027612_79820 [Microbispora bryophytorum subsp. camponoti]